jgi:hypothetical protein
LNLRPLRCESRNRRVTPGSRWPRRGGVGALPAIVCACDGEVRPPRSFQWPAPRTSKTRRARSTSAQADAGTPGRGPRHQSWLGNGARKWSEGSQSPEPNGRRSRVLAAEYASGGGAGFCDVRGLCRLIRSTRPRRYKSGAEIRAPVVERGAIATVDRTSAESPAPEDVVRTGGTAVPRPGTGLRRDEEYRHGSDCSAHATRGAHQTHFGGAGTEVKADRTEIHRVASRSIGICAVVTRCASASGRAQPDDAG